MEWKWNGWQEIAGCRKRYRVSDVERLCWRLEAGSLEQLRKNLDVSLRERIARGELQRERRWTESLAVGSVGFLERIKPLILSRRETEIVATENGTWILQQSTIPYGQETGAKILS